jgi:UDP-N-acetyl-D-mannosaminuronic acid dehydrogenase
MSRVLVTGGAGLIGSAVVRRLLSDPDFEGPERLRAVASLGADDCLIVDPWNCFGSAQVFAYAAEVAALTRTLGATP